jgi:hypothetical protein
VVFLIFGHVVDMVPHNNPQVGLGFVFRYLVEAIDLVGHVVNMVH